MGLPIPTRVRTIYSYIPWWPTSLIVSSVVTVSIWVHYSKQLYHSVDRVLLIFSTDAGADNFALINQSVVATSVLYMLISTGMYGVMLWNSFVRARQDLDGQLRDTTNWILQMSWLGFRISWWFVMTWMLVLIVGCGVAAAYISNLKYVLGATLEQLAQLPPLSPAYRPEFPNCPSQCVNLWIIDYVQVPTTASCFCDISTLEAAHDELRISQTAVNGLLVAVFFMYIIGGFWRSEMSKLFMVAKSDKEYAQLLNNEPGPGGGMGSGPGRGGPRRK